MESDRYKGLVRHVQEVVSEVVPAGATVAVVSRGDEQLLELDGRRGWHFPQDEDGKYLGYHPADSAAAVAHLEELRKKGAEYLLLPGTSFWWLAYYEGFRKHLDERYRSVVGQEDCLVYSLVERADARRFPTASLGRGQLSKSAEPRGADQLRDLVHHLLPLGAVVAFLQASDEGFIGLDGQEARGFKLTAGEDPHALIDRLRTLQEDGVEYLLIPGAADEWVQDHPEMVDNLRNHHRLITKQEQLCEIYELCAESTVGNAAGQGGSAERGFGMQALKRWIAALGRDDSSR